MSFNLSEWALRHRSFVVYLMIASVLAGAAAFNRLGRNEDPAFVIKTMIVQAGWPGATLNDTVLQVTERLERTLQETPNLDFLRSYTSPGLATIFVNLKGETPPGEVPDIWYHVRKSVADMRHTLPSGIVGPGFNDEFGDTYGIIYGFTSDGFSERELRDHVEEIRSRLLLVRDVSKIEIVGAQDERIFVEFSMQQLAGLGIDRSALISALQAQNVVSPAGIIQTGDEKLLLRVSGAFESEQDLRDVNFVASGRLIRLRDIAQIRRGFADPPQPMFRVNGRSAIGLAIAMREGGDILALGRNIETAMHEITADLPIGIEPILVADQPHVVDHAIRDFTTSLWQAIAIIMAVSFVSLGMRAGAVVASSIPLTLAVVFPIMQFAGIDLQRISLGALIIALGLLVDDAMTTIDVMSSRLDQGDGKVQAATFAYRYAGLSDADRKLHHGRGLRADRLRQKLRGRVHLLDLRRRRHRADRVLVRGRPVRAAARRRAPGQTERLEGGQAEPDPGGVQRLCSWRDAGEVAHDRDHARLLRRGARPLAAHTPAVLPAIRPARSPGRPEAAAERLDRGNR